MRHILLLIITFFSLSCTSKVQTKEESSFTSSDTLRMFFAGDLMQHQAQIQSAYTDQGYNYKPCFQLVKDEIKKADFAIANLEVTIGGKPYKGYPAFSAPDEFIQAIQEAGFNVLTTANNHCLDRGRKGLERTIHILDSLKIQRVGTYIDSLDRALNYPLVLKKKGFCITLLNYTYGTNGIRTTPPNHVNYIDTTVIAQDIERCKEVNPDIIIACMHWGEEYKSIPNQSQKKLAQWLFHKGVTHIIGTHPHVLQPIIVEKDSASGQERLLAYSLGNYISDMKVRRTDGGIMLRMEWIRNNQKVILKKCEYDLVWTSRPIHSKQKIHQLHPINHETDSLTQNALNSLNIFIKDTRELFKRHNKGIKERISFKKKSKILW